MYTITLYWKNKDIGEPYFYVVMRAVEKDVSPNQRNYSIDTDQVMQAQSFDEVMAFAQGMKRWCGIMSYEKFSENVNHFISPHVRALLHDLRHNRGPVSIDALAVPDKI